MKTFQTWSFEAEDHVAALTWLPDSHTLAVAPLVGSIVLIDRITGKVQRTLPGDAVSNCALSASSSMPSLVTGGQEGTARIWNTETGELLHELRASDGANDWCEHARFSRDGTLLATGAGRTLRVWASNGTCVFENAACHSTIAALEWRPDGAGVATGCYNGVQLFRAKNGKWEPHAYEVLHWKGSILSLAWSPNGRYIAGGSQEATIQFWRLPYRTGEELFMSGYTRKVRELAWNSGSRYLASGGGEVVTVWDVSGKGPAGTTPRQFEGHKAPITQLAFQRRGHLLASSGADGRVFVWDLAKENRHRYEFLSVGSIVSLSWSPDDTALAIGCADGNVSLFEFPFE